MARNEVNNITQSFRGRNCMIQFHKLEYEEKCFVANATKRKRRRAKREKEEKEEEEERKKKRKRTWSTRRRGGGRREKRGGRPRSLNCFLFLVRGNNQQLGGRLGRANFSDFWY